VGWHPTPRAGDFTTTQTRHHQVSVRKRPRISRRPLHKEADMFCILHWLFGGITETLLDVIEEQDS
jgi:hypothetical protein